MKKVFLILFILFLITGCTVKEKTIENPNGTSMTYNFFKGKYSEYKYTLKLKNKKENIVISRDNNKIYYENNSEIIIEKSNIKYVLNKTNKTYTEQKILQNDNYLKGYLPNNIEEYKNKNYTLQTRTFSLTKCEKYNYSEGNIIYCFKNKKLKTITNQTATNETTVNYEGISKKVDDSNFKINKEYEKIEY